MLYHHIRNYGCRISTDYFYRDMRVAVLENQLLRISVLIDKGTDIFEFQYKPKGMDFMWLSPWGINSPSKFVPSVNSRYGNFMDFYEGGWQEILPNFGYGGVFKGAEEGLHGEVSLIPWDFEILEDTPSAVSIKFKVRTYRTPFYLEKTLALKSDDPRLYITEKLKNEGYQDIDLMWTHHPTYGGEFLGENVVIDVPKCAVKFVLTPEVEKSEMDDGYGDKTISWPRFAGYSGKEMDFSRFPTSDIDDLSTDEICIGDLDDGWYAVTNLDKNVGIGLSWDKGVFPYVWIWRMYGKGAGDFPWWGRVRCMALEVGTSYSYRGLAGAIKNGTALKMKPQQEIKTSFLVVAYEGNSRIKNIDSMGNVSI
ncbi:MAG: DUF4432 family protein [Actinobacteria bacterium]|nr:DUF4432 family protein [Actinomycetota bacterium]